MRSLGIAALILTLAVPVFAQTRPQKPTFSIVTETPRQDFEVGAAVFNTGSAQIRIAYLPRLAPFPGTFPTRSWGMPPNPLALTRTQIPEKPRVIPAYIYTR